MIIMYLIQNKSDSDLYWSNELGWMDLSSATEFTAEEKQKLNLPINGYWVQIRK